MDDRPMKWWEYLMVWRWFGEWRQGRAARKAKQAETEAKFQALLSEAEERRGDFMAAVVELREDREKRQAASLRRPRIPSSPAHQE